MNHSLDHKRRNYHYQQHEGGKDHSSDNGKSAKYDDPPNSRLFIVCGKQITEDQFKSAFSKFGTIEEVWVLKDRVTAEPKGVTYIKFSKTSEAALAMEMMNGQCIAGSPRPLKVLIAHSRDQGSRRDMNEEERLVRLFVVVNKSMNEAELKDHFAGFGDIDYVSIVRDRNTKESKGFAYVKYHRMSHAAKAFEECDRAFKPVFAEPKPQKSSGLYQDHHNQRSNSHHQISGNNANTEMVGPGSTASGSTTASAMSTSYDMLAYMDTTHSNPESVCRLLVTASPTLSQDQVWRLFDLVPGLDYCDRARSNRQVGNTMGKGLYTVVYNNSQSATYAKEKLHGFEYPPGFRMVVRFEESPNRAANNSNQAQIGNRNAAKPNLQNDLAHLTETIANATALLQAAGYAPPPPSSSSSGQSPAKNPEIPPTRPQETPASTRPTEDKAGETYDPSYCSVKLPSPQPLAAMDSSVAERLFVVCTPVPPQLYTLKDVFGRFENGGMVIKWWEK